MTAEETQAVSHECTRLAMQELVHSPGFGTWMIQNFDRLAITPRSVRDERPEDEIPQTAFMEEGFEGGEE